MKHIYLLIGLIILIVIGIVVTAKSATDSEVFDDQFEVGGTLPPDPGQAGMATLEGIDSDNDGVRDDVQRYIAFEYPNAPATRAALTQYTKAYQQTLLDADDKALSRLNSDDASNASMCIWHIHGLDGGKEITDIVLAEILNTPERSRAYIKYNQQLGGGVYSIPDGIEGCDQKVRSLLGGMGRVQ